MSMLSWVSFSHVRSMHSYTDCRISLGSSSTHLKTTRRNPIKSEANVCKLRRNSVKALHGPFFGEALLEFHLMMAEELGCFRIEHLQERNGTRQMIKLQPITKPFIVHSFGVERPVAVCLVCRNSGVFAVLRCVTIQLAPPVVKGATAPLTRT